MTRESDKFYGLFLDRTGDPRKYLDLHETIKNEPAVEAWWHYMPSVYLLKLAKPMEDFTEQVRTCVGDAPFFVIKVDPSHVDGWLPKRAWHWFQRHMEDEYAG